jgi:hypothetical protein
MAGLESIRSAALTGLVRRASDYADTAISTAGGSGIHRVLPVLPELSRVLPGQGLRRGSTIAVRPGQSWPAGGSSLVLALIAEASRSGSWCAVVGIPTFGAVAAAEAGIALERLALVPYPGPEWPTVVAALIDGVDVVISAVPAAVSGSIASRLSARARQRGCVLVPYGQWEGADVTLEVTRGTWEGLGQGHGRLRRRQLSISVRGRGAASLPREITVWMPDASGRFGIAAGGEESSISGRPALTLITGLAEINAADPADPAAADPADPAAAGPTGPAGPAGPADPAGAGVAEAV